MDGALSQSDKPLPTGPVVLLLLDGWGVGPLSEANALAGAKTPFFDSICREYPLAALKPEAKSLNARYLALGSGRILEEEDVPPFTLTRALSASGKTQAKITETERLAALTHFFNGHAEERASKEDWVIVSSETKDKSQKPSLALSRIVRASLKTIKEGKHDFIAISIPTLDLAAASGDMELAKKTATAVDKQMRKIFEAVASREGILIVTAACGNAESMKNLAMDLVDKDMTSNPVPFIIVGQSFFGRSLPGAHEAVASDLSLLTPAGTLADVSPTILDLMGLPKQEAMEGQSLI